MISFAALPLAANVAVFAAAAFIVWLAGIRLTAYAKVIAERTGAEQAFVGILLLGAVVSLPEMATSSVAAANGQARLAVNTLLGGIAATVAILAVTDALTGAEPLSTDISHPIVLLQGILVADSRLLCWSLVLEAPALACARESAGSVGKSVADTTNTSEFRI
jgi:cation:H+ antiporter